ncbi:hypothetical protein Lesp02_14940 [Lentzea sp. NBRC 105346]|uniref:hypothetical protein n=1 Tax=Lentzea sp. NBRC 105346 TaxID=3032205 RepID=UPI0024A3A917|nr:hypothetical protein [Lentzea sp. NBRC 105346]GLZ29304.1 hypothetical protein Lesp02_14940 [Lentzea sp. NBRC 105346]
MKEESTAMSQPDDLRARIVRIVVESAEGDLSEQDLVAAGGSLPGVSYSSLSLIRMIDAVENQLGVYLDPDSDSARFETIDSLVELVSENLCVSQ